MKKGFTLIELLIVVAIIGILAGVGIPMYNGYMTQAKINASQANHAAIKSFIAVKYTSCGGSTNVMPLPGYENKSTPSGWWELNCSDSANAHYWYFAHYFDAYMGFKNPYDGLMSVHTNSSPSPKLGYTNLYGKGNTIYIYTNIGNESGDNVYLSDSIALE